MRRVFFFSIVAIVLLVTIPAFAQQEFYQVTTTAYCSCQKCCGKAPSHKAYGVTKSGIRLSDNLRCGSASRAVSARVYHLHREYRVSSCGGYGGIHALKGGKWVVDVHGRPSSCA